MQKLPKSKDCIGTSNLFFRTHKAVCRVESHRRVKVRRSPILILTTAIDFVKLSTGVMDDLNFFFDGFPDSIETVHDHEVKRFSSRSAGSHLIIIL